MSLVGCSIGRLRSAITLMSPAGKIYPSTVSMPSTFSVVKIIPHSGLLLESIPMKILETLKDERRRMNISLEGECQVRVGVLSRDRFPNREGRRDDKKSLFQIHTVVGHELKKEFGVIDEIPMSVIQHHFGIRPNSKSGTADFNALFQADSTLSKDLVTTRSALELMAESWGVARVLHHKLAIDSFRSSNPAIVETFRTQVRQKKHLRDFGNFSLPSSGSRKSENLADVMRSLVEQEVDKLIVRRITLTS